MVSARNSRTQGLRILKLQPDLFLGAMVSSAVTRVACLYCAASSCVVSVEDRGHWTLDTERPQLLPSPACRDLQPRTAKPSPAQPSPAGNLPT